MPGIQINLRNALSPRILSGGGASRTTAAATLKRAPVEARPKVLSQGRYKGDNILTRTGGLGATELGRMARAMSPARPLTPPPRPAAVPEAAPVARPAPAAPPAAPAAAPGPVKALADQRDALTAALAELRDSRPRPAGTTLKQRLEAEAALVGRQITIKARADVALAQVGPLLAAGPSRIDDADQAQVRALRRDLVALQIETEFLGLGQVAAPVPRLGTVQTLWALHGGGPGRPSKEPLLGEATIARFGRMLDAFNGGAATAKDHDGRSVTAPAFAASLDRYADILETRSGSTFAADATRELRAVAAGLRAREAFRGAVSAVEDLLDRNPALPVGGALRAVAGMMPGLREAGQQAGSRDVLRCAEGLRDMVGLIASGHALDNLQGHDTAFDAAWLTIKRQAGGERAIELLRDRCAAEGRPLLSDAALTSLTALAAKPDEALSVRERARLLDLSGHVGLATLPKARALLDGQAEAIAAARAAGQTAAELHHGSVALNKRFAEALTADRRVWYRPSTWGEGKVRVFNEATSVLKGRALVDALKAYGGRATGRDIALLTAQLCQTECEAIRAEKAAFGLHPGIDLARLVPDPAKPLEHVGITNRDLAAIGVTAADFPAVADIVGRLYRQGIGGIAEIEDHTRTIAGVAHMAFRSLPAQGLVRDFTAESPRAMGQHLLDALVGEADARTRSQTVTPPSGARLTLDSDTVRSRFEAGVRAVRTAIEERDPAGWDGLQASARTYRDGEAAIVARYGDYRGTVADMAAARDLLAAESRPEGLGIDVDPHAPRGLRSAKAVLVALRSEAEIGTADTESRRDAARSRRDAALDTLRGLDVARLRRPWHAKLAAAFGAGDRPDVAQLARLKAAAEAIVMVREDGPTRQRQLADGLAADGGALDALLDARRSAAPTAMRTVTDMVRAAVLHEWRNPTNDPSAKASQADLVVKGGEVAEGFNPAIPPARTLIETRLKSWGLDLDRFAPELDTVLFGRLSPSDLQRWAGEMDLSATTRARLQAAEPRLSGAVGVAATLKAAGRGASDALAHRAVMDAETRSALSGLLASFQEGDKLDLKAGQRVTLDSGKIPVEPSGLVGLKAKIAAAHLGQFEIERGSDGYKLHLRTGVEGKGNLDVVAGEKFTVAGGIDLSVEGTAGIEGSASRLQGVSISFRGDAAGLDALLNLVGKMVDGQDITYADWKDATDVGRTVENRTKGSAAVGFSGRALFGGKGPGFGGKPDTIGDGFSASIGASGARGTKGVGVTSLNERTTKSEVEYSLTASAGGGFYAKVYNPLNMATGDAARASGGAAGAAAHFGADGGSPRYNIADTAQNTEIVGIGASVTLSYTDKSKVVRDGAGFYGKCEKVRQSTTKTSPVAKFRAVDTPALRKLLDDPANPDLRRDLKTFMDLMGPSDSLAVTYALRPDKLAEANELVGRANAARRQGDGTRAQVLERLAGRLVDDEANYRPTKVGLLTISVKKSEVTAINARWIKWDSFSDGKSEHQGAVLALPA